MGILLSEKEEKQFIEEGYFIIEKAFDPGVETFKSWIEDVWERCQADKDKPESWPR